MGMLKSHIRQEVAHRPITDERKKILAEYHEDGTASKTYTNKLA